MTQHSVVGWLGRERKCHARDARQLDPSCVEQALIALRDVAPTVWKRFRAEPLMPGFHTQKEEKHLTNSRNDKSSSTQTTRRPPTKFLIRRRTTLGQAFDKRPPFPRQRRSSNEGQRAVEWSRRFPPPLSVEDGGACLVVKDGAGEKHWFKNNQGAEI